MSIRRAAQRLAAGGLIESDVPGRTDRIPGKLQPGAYVIPADVVSALGEGNSAAGAKILDNLTTSGNWAGRKGDRFAAAPNTPEAEADVIVAGGEYIVPVDRVKAIGGGSLEVGHKTLDRFVKSVRQKQIHTLRNLPGPKA
jgi:hypothetical protein